MDFLEKTVVMLLIGLFVGASVLPVSNGVNIDQKNQEVISEREVVNTFIDQPKEKETLFSYPINTEKESSEITTYDFVIITPEVFADDLTPLVDHKNSLGISTIMQTTEFIYDEYDGVDDAERIKIFIKDAIESYNIDYVLLIGDENYIPVRYSHLDDGADTSFPSDLYYADVYKEYGEFESWDSNGNGIFAEWTDTSKDELDLYPDVHVGRIPCTCSSDLIIYIDKIITYESNQNTDWFNNVLLCGGDTCTSVEGNEGEIINDEIATVLSSGPFSFQRLWGSNGLLTVSAINDAIDSGVGFIDFSGFGEWDRWLTHPPNDGDTFIPTGGYTNDDVLNLNNNDKLPVIMLGGAYCADIDTLYHSLADSFLFHEDGGGIGVFGSTANAWYICSDNPIAKTFGFMEHRVFMHYEQQQAEFLGLLWTKAIIDYIDNFDVMNDKFDCKTVQEFILIGDPTLMIQWPEQDKPVRNIDTGESFSSIQQAIDDADTLNGHTITVDSGIYEEHVLIDKSIILVGEDRIATVIDGTESGSVIKIVTDNVVISNLTICNSGTAYYGIKISAENVLVKSSIIKNNYHSIELDAASNGCNIFNNQVSNNTFGIAIRSSNNTVESNQILNISASGICHYYGTNNLILNNYIANLFQGNGITLSQHSEGTYVIENCITNTTYGIVMDESSDVYISENDIHDNVVDGFNLYNVSDLVILYNQITGNGQDGIHLRWSQNVTIEGNTIFGNEEYGIYSYTSNENQFSNNFVSENILDGIFLRHSNGNVISSNDISLNDDGCYFVQSHGNCVMDNFISENLRNNLILSSSNQNFFNENEIVSTDDDGLQLFNCTENVISQNLFSNLGLDYNILLHSSNLNNIYDNIFEVINKGENAFDDGINQWNQSETVGLNILGGPFIGGNYFSDHSNQDTNGDGFADDPYAISGGNNVDYLPLVQQTNTPPDPPVITGPEVGSVGDQYTYEISTIDPENDLIYYFVDWDDGSTTDWLGPYASGETMILDHTWYDTGSYVIKVKAKDEFGLESDWSSLQISIFPNDQGQVIMDDVCISVGTGMGSGWLHASDIDEAVGSGEWTISYDPSLLQVTDVLSGDFETLYSYVDEDAGEIRLVATNSGSGLTGDFAIAQIFFEALRYPICNSVLSVTESTLYTAESQPESIPHTVYDGMACSGCHCVLGDMNGDCELNSADVRYLALNLCGDPDYTPLYAPGDVNSDGVVNSGDVRYLALYLCGDPDYSPLYP